ncbi:MAG: segregation/condensation protein A [Candidatus Pacearchaeota archaeon]|nr:segregation/condensation protein A [Candidatus Pacearchaeota archaeon]
MLKEVEESGNLIEIKETKMEEGDIGDKILEGNDLKGSSERVGQEQVQDLLFNDKLSWQAIIYDLINTEQLNPWDIDIALLSNRYLEKIKELEEANFFVSSKVLLAASILLRIKSEVLLNRDLPGLDAVLYGRKEEKKYEQEKIEFDEEMPDLVPRTPLPRFKRVTLKELMDALGNAIKTENRRIKREIVLKQREGDTNIVLPRNTINLKDKINVIYKKLKDIFSNRDEKLAFSELLKMHKEDRVVAFVSLLHLDTQQKVWLEQEGHFEEIWVLLKDMYEVRDKERLDKLRAEVIALENEQVSDINNESEEFRD